MIKESLDYECVIQVLRTANALWRESRHFFRPFGLTEAQFNVLNLLGKAKNGLSQRELSDLLLVDRSNVTLLLDRMEKHGWITRQDDPKDRRIYRVIPTKLGKTLWLHVLPIYHRAIGKIMKNLSQVELRKFLKLLQAIENNSGKWK